jgi:hypothetical protein
VTKAAEKLDALSLVHEDVKAIRATAEGHDAKFESITRSSTPSAGG